MPPRRSPADSAGKIESIPSFKTPADPFRPPESSPPASPGLETNSESPPSPQVITQPVAPTTTSSPGSSDPDTPPRPEIHLDRDTAEALEAMATGVAHLGGLALNKVADRRQPIKTDRWKMTEDEAGAIGSAVASLATKRLPEAVTEGDGPELLQITSVLVGYGIRNALNVSPAEMARATEDFAAGRPAPGPGSVPPPPPVNQWPTAPLPRTWAPQPQAPAPAPPAPAPRPAPAPAPGAIDGVAPPATQASDVIELLSGDAL
jgi:hypothetical protein